MLGSKGTRAVFFSPFLGETRRVQFQRWHPALVAKRTETKKRVQKWCVFDGIASKQGRNVNNVQWRNSFKWCCLGFFWHFQSTSESQSFKHLWWRTVQNGYEARAVVQLCWRRQMCSVETKTIDLMHTTRSTPRYSNVLYIFISLWILYIYICTYI